MNESETTQQVEVVTESDIEAVTEVDSTSPASETDIVITSYVSTEADQLLLSVQTIEQIEYYKLGTLMLGVAVFLSVIIIKTFFGKGV